MADTDYLPRRVQTAWSRSAVPESVKAMLLLHGNPEYCSHWDDFLGDSIHDMYPANGGTGTQVVGVTAAPNGTLTVVSQGNQATDSAVQSGPGLHWNGDLGIYFAARLKVNTITSCKWSVGLTDEQTDTGPVNSKANATFNVSDFIGLSFDTADDTNVTVQSNGGSTDLNADTTFTLVANTYFVVEIVCKGNHASVFINGTQVGGGAEVIEGGVDLMPIFFVEQNDTAARTMTVDWFFITGPRT